jgi:hypothetical protein
MAVTRRCAGLSCSMHRGLPGCVLPESPCAGSTDRKLRNRTTLPSTHGSPRRRSQRSSSPTPGGSADRAGVFGTGSAGGGEVDQASPHADCACPTPWLGTLADRRSAQGLAPATFSHADRSTVTRWALTALPGRRRPGPQHELTAKALSNDESDTARAEFEVLRSELLARSQGQSAIVATALTVLAAIGGFALARQEGRVEMLLVLPLVLSGLGLMVVEATHANRRIGHYIREYLWRRLPHNSRDRFPSWEHYIKAYRERHLRKGSVFLALSSIPAVLIYGVPSVASLAVTADEWNSDLWPLWWGGLFSICVFGLLAWSLRRESPWPTEETNATPAAKE